jgi:two-component system cell cycle response regulator DivK
MRILVADDDRVTSRVICDELTEVGHSVVPVFDAMQVLMVAMRQPAPEAIILDLTMPGGTGIEALKKLKMSTKTMGIPVLVLSGTIDARMPDIVKQLGAAEFIPKPVAPDVLLANVASLDRT